MPRLAKTTIESCSIPVEFHVPGVPLFSPKWWQTLTKKDAFYAALTKYMSPTTFAKRFKVNSSIEIRTGVDGLSQPQAKKKQERKARAQSTLSAPMLTPTPEVAEEDEADALAGLAREAQELQDMGADNDTIAIGRRQPRRAAGKSRVEKVECIQCGDLGAWDKMDLDDNSSPICFKCRDGDGEQPENHVTVEVPIAPVHISPVQLQEDFRASPIAERAPMVIKTEDDDSEVIQVGPTTRVSAPKRKRQREDNGQVVTIQGREYLVFTNSNGSAQLVKLESKLDKRIKFEVDG